MPPRISRSLLPLIVASAIAIAGCAKNHPVAPVAAGPAAHTWEDLGLTTSYAQANALAEFQGRLYAGGNFFGAAGSQAASLVSWSESQWFAPASQPNSDVLALTVYGSLLVAGGAFDRAGRDSTGYLAAWDGLQWRPIGGGMDWDVLALAVQGTDLYAGGVFLHAGGVPARLIARWDGSAWHAMGSGMDDVVAALAVYHGELIAGGWFQTAGGVSAHYIAAWNGSNWHPLGAATDLNGVVRSLTVLHDTLFVGGHFSMAGGMPAYHVACWNGAMWDSLGPGLGQYTQEGVLALSSYQDHLIAGGEFPGIVATWRAGHWVQFGSLIGMANVFAEHGSRLYAGGWFDRLGGTGPNGVTRWAN